MGNKVSWKSMMEPQMERRDQLRTPFLVVIVVTMHVMTVGTFVFIQGCGRTTSGPRMVEPPPSPVMPPKTRPHVVNTKPRPVFQPAPVDMAPPVAEPVEAITYTIQKGDSLSKIAARHGVTARELAELNNIKNPNTIRVGQKLILPSYAKANSSPAPRSAATTLKPKTTSTASKSAPAGTVHVVQRGDSLSKIAKAYGTSVNTLKSINGLSSDKILVGQKIKVSDDGKAVAMKKSDPAPAPKEVVEVETPKKAPEKPAAMSMAAPIDSPQEMEEEAAPSPDLKPLPYTVQQGETLEDIAKLFVVRQEEILELNGLEAGASIKEGQTLLIPPPDF